MKTIEFNRKPLLDRLPSRKPEVGFRPDSIGTMSDGGGSRNKFLSTLLIILGLFIVISGCASPQELVEYGNYDEALSVAIRKVAGRKKKKEEYVRALEEAFARANERDLREADRLKLEGQPGNWERIYDIYQRIGRRQASVEPLLPLYDRSGAKARIEFVNIDERLRESRQRAAEYLYTQAMHLLADAEDGDRQAAREAYDLFGRTERYYSGNFRDRESMKRRARELGMTHILVTLRNQTPTLLPAGFEREVLGFNLRELDSPWRRFHLQPEGDGYDYHYRVELRLDHIAMTPALVREREYEESCEIQDGFEYVLDERGNVKKDSLGNDIKVPRKIRVRAWVLESYQHKAAQVRTSFTVFDQQSGRLLDTRPITAEAIFENRAGRFRGDERALSGESRQLIRRAVLPFPTDFELLVDAAVRLRPELRRSMDGLRGVI